MFNAQAKPSRLPPPVKLVGPLRNDTERLTAHQRRAKCTSPSVVNKGVTSRKQFTVISWWTDDVSRADVIRYLASLEYDLDTGRIRCRCYCSSDPLRAP
jgi:hypothetical protein